MPPTMKRSRKQRTEAAIAYALERRWDEAATENRSLLDEFPDDIEAANRLGKALTELGDLDGATTAYGRSLEIDGSNVIARRNLTRIEELRGQPKGGTTAKRRARARRPSATPPSITAAIARPHSLIEESGRSAEFTLLDPNAQALSQVTAGDTAELVQTPRGVSIQSAAGALLGHVEPRAAIRLRRLMDGGNQYAVVIRRIADGETTIYIRETHRAAELADQPSFLQPSTAARKRTTTTRAYTKTSVLRYGTGGSLGDDDEGDGDSWERRGASDDDEMDGFGHASLQDQDQDDDDDEDDGLASDDDDATTHDDEEDEL